MIAHHQVEAPSLWLTAAPWFGLLLGACVVLAVAANWMLKPCPVTERPLSLADVGLDVTEPARRTARHRRWDDGDAARDNGRWLGVHRHGRAPYAGRHRPARGRWAAPEVGRLDEDTISWATVDDLHRLFTEAGFVTVAEARASRPELVMTGGTR